MIIKEREITGPPIVGMDPVLDKILRARSITSAKDVDYQLSRLLPYQLLKDIDKACARLHQALSQNEYLVVIGDYDVDGATATTVMVSGLREMGLKIDYLIPNRLKDGYGLSAQLVDRAESMGAQLIITVDNGIVSHQGVDHANAKGIDVLVTDHHLAGDKVPNAIIVNPNQPGCTFPSKVIAGVGVAFYVLIALRAFLREQHVFEKGPNLLKYLDLVALGTVADCVPLDFNNRTMVAQGLSIMRSGKARPGIAALLSLAKKAPTLLDADDMGFSVAPRLNAAGRLEDMSTGVKCLLSKGHKEAMQFALQLDEINKLRRSMQQEMVAEALLYVKTIQNADTCIAVIYNATWHEGIIGLVASMVKEKFHIPSIVLTKDEEGGFLKGSCRSIPGLNIRDLLVEYDRRYPNTLVKFGGHAMAAGLSLEAEALDIFQSGISSLAKEQIDDKMRQKVLLTDGDLPQTHRSIQFAKLLINSGPWGNGFEKPLFCNIFELSDQYIVGEKHLKVTLSDGDSVYSGIWFNIEEDQWPKHQIKTVKVVYQLQINVFNAKRQLQFLVIDMAPCSQ